MIKFFYFVQIEILSTTSLNVETVAILTGSVIGAGALCFICGALFGMLCCRIIRQTKIIPHETVPGEMANNSENVPVYEDIKLDDAPFAIELSRNIAYEQVLRT